MSFWGNGERIRVARSMLPKSEERNLSQVLSNWLLQERIICEQKKREAEKLSAIIEMQSQAAESALRRVDRKIKQMEERLDKSTVMGILKVVKRVDERCTKLTKDLTAICEELSHLSEEWQREFNTLSRRMGKAYAESKLWKEALAYASKQLKK